MQNLSKYFRRYFFLPRRSKCSIVCYGKEKVGIDKLQIVYWRKDRIPYSIYPFIDGTIFKEISTKHIIFCNWLLRHEQNSQVVNRISNRNISTSSSNDGRPNSESSNKSNKNPSGDQDRIAAAFKLFCSMLLMNVVFYLITARRQKIQESPFISWNEFVHQMLAKGEVTELIVKPEMDWVTIVLHEGAIINGKRSELRFYQMIVANAAHLEKKLREAETALGIKFGQGVPVIYDRGSDNWSSLLIFGFIIYILTMLSKTKHKPGFLSKDLFGGLTRAKFTLVDPVTGKGKGVKFSDVAGLKEAKIEVMEFVDYLKRPEHYKTLGAKVPRGALLLGPPGCGKTMLAKAVATEANVPFLSMNGSEFIEMIGGLGAARVRNLFKEARKRAPSILYIDEIDAIGKKRSGTRSGATGMAGTTGESEQTLNQLLVEMDGMASREGVIVLSSTNRAEVLDKALLRPGRFDRHILIDLPTLQERKEIFERHLQTIVLEKKPEVYAPRLAQLTPGFSGADIANVCNEAALYAAREKKKIVVGSDLSYAIDKVICGPEKKDHGVSPAEKKIVAYHEAGHALVAWLLKYTDALLKVTIKPRTRGMLGFAQYTPTERKNFNQTELFEMMCVALGGRVAESIIFNRVTTGAQNDLEKVNKIAYSQIRQFGMNTNIGLISFSEDETSTATRKPYSKKLANSIDAEARLMIFEAYKATEKLLTENRHQLEKVAQALLKQETLTYKEVEALIGPPPFGVKKKVDFLDMDTPITIKNAPAMQSQPS